jgi:hypothetical protein
MLPFFYRAKLLVDWADGKGEESRAAKSSAPIQIRLSTPSFEKIPAGCQA